MMAEFARNRIAKLRNDTCYSRKGLDQKDLINNKEYSDELALVYNWFEIR